MMREIPLVCLNDEGKCNLNLYCLTITFQLKDDKESLLPESHRIRIKEEKQMLLKIAGKLMPPEGHHMDICLLVLQHLKSTRHKAVNMSRIIRKQTICIGENKDAIVFATQIVQFLYFFNPKFPAASSHLLCLYGSVCVGPV